MGWRTVMILGRVNVIISFRSVCLADAVLVLAALDCTQCERISIYPDRFFPDVEVEVQGALASKDFQQAMSQVEDSHVMLETVAQAPRSQNSMCRLC